MLLKHVFLVGFNKFKMEVFSNQIDIEDLKIDFKFVDVLTTWYNPRTKFYNDEKCWSYKYL